MKSHNDVQSELEPKADVEIYDLGGVGAVARKRACQPEMVSPSWGDRLASLGALRTPYRFCMNNMLDEE